MKAAASGCKLKPESNPNRRQARPGRDVNMKKQTKIVGGDTLVRFVSSQRVGERLAKLDPQLTMQVYNKIEHRFCLRAK